MWISGHVVVNQSVVSTPPLRTVWVLPLLVAASLLLNACVQQAGVKHPTYSRSDVAIGEYRDEATRLRLAPGWTWPKTPIPSTYRGSEVRYEKGYGTQAADHFWFCSWAAQALETRPETEERAVAVDQLQTLRSKYYFEVLNTKSKPYVERELKRARGGNLDLVQRDVELNCPDHK
jgi:hypothetical protein